MSAAAAAPAAASSSAWAGYCPDVEEPAYIPQGCKAGEAPKGMHMLVDGETGETTQAIKNLPAVKDIGLFAQDLERCRKFFQDGVGSPYVRKELMVTGDPVNPSAGDWAHCYLELFEGAAVQIPPPDASFAHAHNIQVIQKRFALSLSHKNGVFTLCTYTNKGSNPPTDALPKKDTVIVTRTDRFTFDNFDSAGKKVNEILQRVGARPAEEMLQQVSLLQSCSSHILAEFWMNNRFRWKGAVFKSKESMVKWTDVQSLLSGAGIRDGLIFTPGKIGDKYYIGIEKIINAHWSPRELYELGFKSRPYDLWDKGPSPVFLKIENTELPLVFSALEPHEMGGMSEAEIREKQELAQAQRLAEIFGLPVARITTKPESWFKVICEGLLPGCCCYYYCFWYCCCDEV